MNCYSVTYSGGNCNYIEVQNGRIVTDSGAIYADLKNGPYSETAMVIDDTGVVQLEAVKAENNGDKLTGFDTLKLQANRTLDQGFI